MTGAGQTINPSGRTLQISGTSTKDLGRTLTNAGMAQFMGGAGISAATSTATWVNQTGSLLDIQADGTVFVEYWYGPLNNAGTIRKSGSTGAATIAWGLANIGGTIEVEMGTLTLRGASGGTASSSGGTFTVASGAVLDLASGQGFNTYGGTYTGAGSGSVQLASGTLYINGGATFNFTGS